jgi:hypothetical protein
VLSRGWSARSQRFCNHSETWLLECRRYGAGMGDGRERRRLRGREKTLAAKLDFGLVEADEFAVPEVIDEAPAHPIFDRALGDLEAGRELDFGEQDSFRVVITRRRLRFRRCGSRVCC